jgi:hypothetical protein
MILAAAVEGTEGFLGAFGRRRLGHPVVAMHRGLGRLDRLAHAVHGFRLRCAG